MSLRVVVTGASGFIGGFVSSFLANQGCLVTAVTRSPVNTVDHNLPELTWQCSDLSEDFNIASNFDAVVHCASELPSRCPDPEILYHSNLSAARNIFEKALKFNIKSVVFLSSMSVYGEITDDVVNENTIPIKPDTYGRSKLASEEVLANCVERGLYSGLSIRLPGTVGRGSHNNFLSNNLKQLLAGNFLQATNPNALFNNIVYVQDLANFLYFWILHPKLGYSVTNLCANEPMQIQDILALMFKITEREERIKFSIGGKKPFLIDMYQAKKFGYKPLSVRESVEAFVRDNLDV